MNLLHKVGVLFHAQDRLSHSLDRFGKKLTDLDAKQKMFERHQSDTARNAERAARSMIRSNQGIERSIEKMSMAQRGYAKFATSSNLAVEKSLESLRMKEAAIAEAKTKFRAKEFAELEKLRAKQGAHATSLVAMEAQTNANIERLHAAHNARMLEQDQAAAAKRNVAQRALQNTYIAQEKARRGGADLLSGAQLADHRLAAARHRGSIDTLVGGREAHRHNLHKVATNAGLTGLARERAVMGGMNAHNREIAAAEKLLKTEMTRIEGHYRLLELQGKEIAAQARLFELTVENANAVAKLNRLRSEGESRILQLGTERYAAAQRGHAADVEHIERTMALELEKNARIIEELEQQKVIKQQIHNQAMAGLQAEHVERQRLLTLRTQEFAAAERAAATELKINAYLERQALIRERTLKIRAQMSAAGAQVVGGGGGSLMSGAMGIATLGWAGHKLVGAAAENEQLDNAIRMNIAGKRDGTGQLWSDVIKNRIAANRGRIPGTKMLMSTLDQKHIVDEQLGAAIAPEHAIANLPLIAMAQRYFEVRGKKPGKGLSKDLATILERAQAFTPQQTEGVLNSIIQTGNVSSRATPKALAEILMKAAPDMARSRMNMRDFSFFDFMLAGNPSGAQAGTSLRALLDTVTRGGGNNTARFRFNDMIKKGYFQGDLGKVTTDRHGKQTFAQGAHPTPLLAGMSFGDVVMRLRNYALSEAGISYDDFLNNKFSNKQNMKFQNIMQESVGSTKLGAAVTKTLSSPMEERRRIEDRHRFYSTGGMRGTRQGQEGMYAENYQNFLQATKELKLVVGVTLLPEMTKLIQNLTTMTLRMTEFSRANPGVLSLVFNTLKWIALAKIANGLALGIPSAIIRGLSGAAIGAAANGFAMRLALASVGGGGVAATVAGGALTRLLVAGLGLVGVGALGMALSALLVGGVVAIGHQLNKGAQADKDGAAIALRLRRLQQRAEDTKVRGEKVYRFGEDVGPFLPNTIKGSSEIRRLVGRNDYARMTHATNYKPFVPDTPHHMPAYRVGLHGPNAPHKPGPSNFQTAKPNQLRAAAGRDIQLALIQLGKSALHVAASVGMGVATLAWTGLLTVGKLSLAVGGLALRISTAVFAFGFGFAFKLHEVLVGLGRLVGRAATAGAEAFKRQLTAGINGLAEKFSAGMSSWSTGFWNAVRGQIGIFARMGFGGVPPHVKGERTTPPLGGSEKLTPLPIKPSAPVYGPTLHSSTGSSQKIDIALTFHNGSGAPTDSKLQDKIAAAFAKEMTRILPATGVNVRLPGASLHQQGMA